MASAKRLVKIKFRDELPMTVPNNTATFALTAKSDSVSETTIAITVPWNDDLVAAHQAALKELGDFGKGLGEAP